MGPRRNGEKAGDLANALSVWPDRARRASVKAVVVCALPLVASRPRLSQSRPPGDRGDARVCVGPFGVTEARGSAREIPRRALGPTGAVCIRPFVAARPRSSQSRPPKTTKSRFQHRLRARLPRPNSRVPGDRPRDETRETSSTNIYSQVMAYSFAPRLMRTSPRTMARLRREERTRRAFALCNHQIIIRK